MITALLLTTVVYWQTPFGASKGNIIHETETQYLVAQCSPFSGRQLDFRVMLPKNDERVMVVPSEPSCPVEED